MALYTRTSRKYTCRPCPCGQSSDHNVPKEKMAVLWLGPRSLGPTSHLILRKDYGGTD